MTPPAAELHPLSAYLQAWLAEGTPDLSRLNAMARARGLVTGNGLPLQFAKPSGGEDGYEERAFLSGEVATRPGNRHDLFNALVWMAWPLAKAALNRRHHAAITDARRRGCAKRGALRDALTQFDECGVVVAGTSPELWQALCAHRWHEVFVARRAELRHSTRFIVFGHASHDALAAPFIGLCGKALFIEVDAAWPDGSQAQSLGRLDTRLAALFDHGGFSPRDWQPLPLLGIPGATVDNEQPDYYADTRQFRPPRRMQPGSSPGNRWTRKCLEESPGPAGRNAG